MPDPSSDDLIRRTLAGERVPLARALSWVENEHPHASALLDACWPHRPRVPARHHGPPGRARARWSRSSRRSTARAARRWRWSPWIPRVRLPGGALLGDRCVRMQRALGRRRRVHPQHGDARQHGRSGRAPAQACDVLDAAGFGRILIETVGVGQSELEVAQTADSTAVVLVPESGDAVQADEGGGS
jgi:LAO/AO transport system kinase